MQVTDLQGPQDLARNASIAVGVSSQFPCPNNSTTIQLLGNRSENYCLAVPMYTILSHDIVLQTSLTSETIV